MKVTINEFPQLETRRLLLREVRLEDSEKLLENYADPHVTEYFMEPLTEQQDAVSIAREYAGHYYAGTGIVWAITFKDDPPLVGTCGYEVLSSFDRRGDIGYDLARRCWGQGLMIEALEAVVEYGFTKLGLNRIQAFVLADNARSINLLNRLHFRVEGVLQEHRWFRGRYWDNVIMALLQKDWESR